jgi:ubiquinol-cytochrome c reductase cytochrome c subunit
MRAIVLLFAAVAIAAPAHAAQSQAERGAELFRRVGCWQCHGTVGQGGDAGPRLAPNPLPAEAMAAYVRRPREMPPYNRSVLSDADVHAIRAYLATINPPPPVDSLEALRPRPATAGR